MSVVASLPVVVVQVDGTALADEDLRALAEIRVHQKLSLPTQCELTFSDPPGPLAGVERLTPGARLRVGIRGDVEPLFAGQVTAMEHVYGPANSREVRVRGYDPLHQLRKRQAVRPHQQVTVRDVVRDLAADLGLALDAADVGPLWQFLIQHRQSDFEFITELAERCGLYLAAHDGSLHLLTLEGTGEPVPLTLGESLVEARVEANAEGGYRSVTAFAWDPLTAEAYEGRASSPRLGREVMTEVQPSRVGGTGTRSLVEEIASAVSHAEALALAELERRAAQEVVLWGIADGDPRLRPGTRVDVSRVAPRFAGRYVLTEAIHTIDERGGFLTELSTAPPAFSRQPASAVVTLGLVTRVDDPSNLGRVRASLPAFGNVETDWMGVLSAGAGSGKGLVVLPDVDDRVLVLLPHQDPAQGIVLGGLYGARGPADSGVEGQSVRRYTLHTAGGQRIQLDDARGSLRMEDREGSFVELSPEGVRLHAAVDLTIDAPGKNVVIRGSAIDFQSG